MINLAYNDCYNLAQCTNMEIYFERKTLLKEELLETIHKAFSFEADSILATKDAVDSAEYLKAVRLLSEAQRIGTAGCGHSGICCMHFAHLLCCMEKPARFISPAEALHGAMGFIQEKDALVLASRGGKTSELLPMLEIARKKGAFVITVTEEPESMLARQADAVLLMCVTRETDQYNSQGTSSFVALSAIFDALQAALIGETGYRSEQFALIHPGGAVGKRLNP